MWLTHHSKKMKLWWLPKIESPILKYNVPPFWPTYIGQRWTTFAKVYGIKVRSAMEENMLGNTLGTWETYWESDGNPLGTLKEHIENQRKMKKKSFAPTLKRNKSKPPWMPSHWLHEISLPKRVGHHFWPGIIAFAKNTLPTHSSQETCVEMIHMKSSWEYGLIQFSKKFRL